MFTVHIKNNKTEEVRKFVVENEDWYDGFEYMWTDGNYSCDCNRALYFARAEPSKSNDLLDIECGETVYSVPFVELEDGTRVNIDDHEQTHQT